MEHSNGNSKKLFIVVIDDSPTVCTILDVSLTREGHQVKSFQDPVLALRSILKTGEIPLPDLFFIDLSLPKISGYEVVRLFKSTSASMHIPVIVITRLDATIARLKVRLAGADAYLEKPFQIPDVIALVRSFAVLSNSNIPENNK